MCKCKRSNRFCKCSCACKILKVLGKIFGIFAAVYAALFAVFFFDLDGKFIYHVVEPFLCKHYDKMERRNPLDVPYNTKVGAE